MHSSCNGIEMLKPSNESEQGETIESEALVPANMTSLRKYDRGFMTEVREGEASLRIYERCRSDR